MISNILSSLDETVQPPFKLGTETPNDIRSVV